ncbi:hypothetical protein OFY01_06025, partial [Streptomyces sp. GXMU-J5]|nr:hypothetical protein [Streptomyces beihaiensis]
TTAPTSAGPPPAATPGRPGQAKDEAARCRSYENGHGLSRADRAAAGCDEPAAAEPAAPAAATSTAGPAPTAAPVPSSARSAAAAATSQTGRHGPKQP